MLPKACNVARLVTELSNEISANIFSKLDEFKRLPLEMSEGRAE